MENDAERKIVTIYADGGCDPNPGPGGYGVVLLHGGKRRELAAGFRLTTNNRMELMGAIAGLEALRTPCRVTVHSDSQYLVQSMSKGWAARWQASGWMRQGQGPVPNADLWERLIVLCEEHLVEFCWVRGHSGDPENERCDALAARARLADQLEPDAGYLVAASERAQALMGPPSPPLPAAGAASPPPDRAPITGGKTGPLTEEGQPCRKCGTPVVRRIPKRRKGSSKLYVYSFYLYCVACKTMYMVDSAKVAPQELERRRLDEHDARRTAAAPPAGAAPAGATPGRGTPGGAPVSTSRTAPATGAGLPVRRVFELVLSGRADRAEFERVSLLLEHDLGARIKHRLEDANHAYRDFELGGKTFQLMLHPEGGIAIAVRGKRNRHALDELAVRLRMARS